MNRVQISRPALVQRCSTEGGGQLVLYISKLMKRGKEKRECQIQMERQEQTVKD